MVGGAEAGTQNCQGRAPTRLYPFNLFLTSVEDPDPQDLHVFGPPGSGSISHRYVSGYLPFLIKVLMLAKRNFNTKFS